jgi:hypothetical protein
MATTIKHTLPFDPRSIAGCSLWFDGADVNGNGTNPANGALVTTWIDKSGNGRNATASAAATYNVSNKAIVFNNSFYTTSYLANPTNETGFYVFLTTSSGGPQMILGTNSGGREIAIYNNGNQFGVINSLVAWGALTPGGTITTNTLYLATSQISSGTSTSISLNGALSFSGSVTVPAFTNGVLTSLGREAGTNFPFLGNVYEIILFNVLLTTSQRQQVEGYLAWKWGVTTSLPATHPFKRALAPFSFPSLPVRPKKALLPYFDPRTIPGCSLWLDAADSSTLTLSGTNVTQWRDKIINLALSNVGTATTLSTSAFINPSLSFNGGYLLSASNLFTTTNNVNTINQFVVMKRTASVTYGLIAGIGFFTQNTKNSIYLNVNRTQIVARRGWTSNNTRYDGPLYSNILNQGYVYSALTDYQASTYQLVSNGTENAVTSFGGSGSTNNDSSLIYLGNTTFNEPFTGNIGEYLIFNVNLTTTQRQQIEGYLAWKWGLQSNLPSNHPFVQVPTNTFQLTAPVKKISTRLPSFLYPSSGYSWYNVRFASGRTFTDVGVPRSGFNGTMAAAYSVVSGPITGMQALSIPFGGTITMPTGYTTGSFTIAFWVNITFKSGTGLGTYQYFLTGGRLQVHQHVRQSQFGGGDINMYFYDTGGSVQISPILTGVWYHMVFTYNTSINQVMAYVDGVLRQTTTQTIGAAATWTIGNTGLTFGGSIADLRVIPSILTASQVNQLYNLYSTGLWT